MRFVLALAFIFLFAGFGDRDSINNNHWYGDRYDAQGASGLKLRYTPTLAAGSQFTELDVYENAFLEVQRCTRLAAPPPFVIVVPNGTFGRNAQGQITGRYLRAPPLVLVEVPTFAFRHEVVHYLLDFSTGDPDQRHRSPLFQRCGSIPL